MTKNIPNETLRNVCKIGQGANCCRYILFGPSGFKCCKLTKSKESIDSNINNMTAKGDNCKGLE